MSHSFRPLGSLAARDYGIRVGLGATADHVEGVLRGIWREDFSNGVPGRSLLVELPGGVEEQVVGPLPVSTRVQILGGAGAAVAAVSPAQAARARFGIVPSIALIRRRFSGGERDGHSDTIAVVEMKSRVWFGLDSGPLASAGSYSGEYVCTGTFAPDGPRRLVTDMVFRGYVTPDEMESAPSSQGAPEKYRVQFTDGPLVSVVDHIEALVDGRPTAMLRLTLTVDGVPTVASYRYANVAARSAGGLRCAYSYVAGSAPSWRA